MTQYAQSVAALGEFTIQVDGQALPAHSGQTVAAVLLEAGLRAWRLTASGAPRGVYCGMGACFDCTVEVEGVGELRACMTPARPGMRITLQTEIMGHASA